ncbi:START domain-containing protein [Bermanella marisrubri]|uniref:START domain-containing protein n=1 Tax=Bermanella marisrubri TaxID=207949 RepID=Q1N5C1_9GAMM|nr:START domain-containing protein [Bermanella marisrubri]EAT13162.1 hypothetical protein RED65_00340 [Oceanobacter sp. RED65] [Bermanella marisrubri]QIZ83935.1 START domain-containing protein [Bermanella marisrubri]
MKLLSQILSIAIFAMLPLQASSADSTSSSVSEWDLEADNEDLAIEVFTRSVGDSPLKEFKGVTFIKAPVTAFVALLEDTKRATQWMHNVIQFDMVEEISDTEKVVYTVNETPWPVTDRDVYVHSSFVADSKGAVTSHLRAQGGHTKNDDFVRMPSIQGKWEFTPQDDGMTKVVYQVHADPGGSLPDWLVNAIVVDTPLNTLENLHEVIHDEQYQDKEYDFINKAIAAD